LYGWKNNLVPDISVVMGRIGASYLTLFQNNQGLSSVEKGAFLSDAGLVAEPPQDYLPTGWYAALRAFGPLWVTTAEPFGLHGRVIKGIFGDGSADGTNLVIVDPADGRSHIEAVALFASKFDAVAIQDGAAGQRPQVVHY
jgi:hypothetical protein